MQKTLVLAVLALSTLAVSAQSVVSNHAAGRRPAAGTIVTFDVPGGTYTSPAGINTGGQIAGSYTNGTTGFGFIRSASGIFTSFGVAGATATIAESINDSGAVTGWYADSSNVNHGFVRQPNGSITTFDPPESSGTYTLSINSWGEVAGYYTVDGAAKGFVRDALGNITTFVVAGAESTVVWSLSDNGSVVGYYYSRSAEVGFIRDSSGTITMFSVPGAGKGVGQGTAPIAINASGEIGGYYITGSYVYHGFSRDVSGNITTLDDPKAARGGTLPSCINNNGEIAGDVESPGITFGFSVDAALDYSSFTVPGADPVYGTSPHAINDSGTITGTWVDATPSVHGFVRY